MLSIDQVKLLETKVAGAVELIRNLSDEKTALVKQMEVKDQRIAELEAMLLTFKEDQTQIEQKVISALNQLSAFEDSVYETKTSQNINSASTENVANTNVVEKPSNPENLGLKDKIEASNNKAQSNLQKDLADVLGTSENEDQEEDSDADKQLDIF